MKPISFSHTPQPEFLSYEQVLEMCPISRQTIERMVKAGHFPRKAKLSARRVGFLKSEVDDWIAQRMGAHRQTRAPIVDPKHSNIKGLHNIFSRDPNLE